MAEKTKKTELRVTHSQAEELIEESKELIESKSIKIPDFAEDEEKLQEPEPKKVGDGKGAIVIMRCGEVPEFFATMKKVSGFANNDPASKFGADARLVKTFKEEIDEQPELLKTPRFKKLEKEFEKLREANPDKQPAEIVKSWENGEEYVKMVKEFNEEMNSFYKQKIQFRFRSHLKPDDFRAGAITDTDVAALLADFWKEELK
jgi:hypothetical protein